VDVGFISRDITPEPGIRLGGYGHRFGRPSSHVVNRLRASILDVVDSRGEEVVLVQMDLLGLYRDDADKIRNVVSKRLNVKPGSVMIATTHTHSAPETVIPMWQNTFPYSDDDRRRLEEWFNSVLNVVEDAVDEIPLRREKAKLIKFGSTHVGGLCFNRAFPGHRVDEELSLIYIEGEDLRVTVASYACHPVTNTGLGISSDYPGAMRDTLERYGVNLVFLTGAAGDVDPKSKGVRYMDYMGRVLAYEAVRLIAQSRSVYPDSATVSTASRREMFKLRKPRKSLDEALKSYYTLLSQYTNIEDIFYDPTWPELLYLDEEIDLIKDPRESVETIFQGLRIGPAVILGVPGELLSETGLYIKETARNRYGNALVIISTCTNDYVGYIPTAEAFSENKYEARLAKWSRLDRDAEPRVRMILLEIVESLLNSNQGRSL